MAALQRGDYTMAMRLIRPLAEQGNAGAQTDLGVIYDTGLGVPQDYAQAVVWYHKAADQGDAGALRPPSSMRFSWPRATAATIFPA
jgi:TPR repeat protein